MNNSKQNYYTVRIIKNIVFFMLIVGLAILNSTQNISPFYLILYHVLLFFPALVNNFYLIPYFRKSKNGVRFLTSLFINYVVGVILLGLCLKFIYSRVGVVELIQITPFGATSDAPIGWEDYQTFFSVFPGILFIMALYAISYGYHEYIFKIQNEYAIKELQIAAQLTQLKSQISPHFLFNVLNSLYALSIKNAPETPDVILKLSDILRYSLYDSQQKVISLMDEVHVINTYLDIQTIRSGEQLTINFSHDIKNHNISIAPMLLLPIIENAFKHGSDSTIGKSFIKIELFSKENELHFICTNSYKSTNHDGPGGIGLENIKKRLDLIYPNTYKLSINNTLDTFSVLLNITIKE